MNIKQLSPYWYLMRFDKPIGIALLLWPTLWALWIASDGHPGFLQGFVFIAGTIVMRAAGCVMNDIADRRFDRFVARTQSRPITSGQVSVRQALICLLVLLLLALGLVLQLNWFTVGLSVIGLLLAMVYPFLKRFFVAPQAGLSLAFAWGIPMAYAAQLNHIPASAWLLFAATMCWIVVYDTLYAMADREDDIKIGLQSTAILFGDYDRLMIGLFQMMMLGLLLMFGLLADFPIPYYIGLVISAGLFIYHQVLIAERQPAQCFRAFQHNHWVGFTIFLTLLIIYYA